MVSASPAVMVTRISGSAPRCSRRSARHAHAVVTFHMAGAMAVDHRGAFQLRAGDVHLIPAGDEHRMTGGRDFEVWGAALRPAGLDRDRFESLLAPLDNVTRGALPRVTIPSTRRDFVASLFTELSALDGRHEPVRRESLLALLLGEIGDHAPRVTAGGARSDVTAQAVAFVAANALAPLSLAEVARGIGRSRSHVAEVVRRETGRSVGAWIMEVRLDEARHRLEETNELIEVIAERAGYRDATHFARTFKRRFAVSPRAWRARHGARNENGRSALAGDRFLA